MIEFLGKIDKLTHDWSTHKYVLGINDLIYKNIIEKNKNYKNKKRTILSRSFLNLNLNE